MTNTAKILNFCRGNFAKQERNVADLDDGYARLSNMLLEAYSGADLTKRQFKVLLAILRKTYGWNKPMDRITDSQLSEITKLPVKRCNEAKLELVRMNIIKQQGGMFGPFSQLLATFPASLANRDQNELNEIRRQWVLAFRENGITTMEQVNAGMRVARRQNRPFLPSPGQFVAWCREEASVIAGLPNVSELVDMVYEYCRKRGLYPDAESYPWKSNAHYWLVTNLYQNMRANALTDAELRRKAADELTCMTARINRGETIPEPVKQLPVMGGRPLNRAQTLAKIAEIKAKFGLKGASV
ncbi:replication protein P [Escherichia coli]|nr:replication protein P [Escherichia coli]